MPPHIRTKPAPFPTRGARHGPILSSRSAARLGALLVVFIFVISLLRLGDNGVEGEDDHSNTSPEQVAGASTGLDKSFADRRYPPRARGQATKPKTSTTVPVDTDPRWDHIAVALRSTFTVINSSLPLVHAAWLGGVKNAIVVGDKNAEQLAGTNLSMINLASDVAEIAMRVNAGEIVVDASGSTTDDEDFESLDEVLATDMLSSYLKDAEVVAARESAGHTLGSSSKKQNDDGKESAYYRVRRMHKRGTLSSTQWKEVTDPVTEHPSPQLDHEFHLSAIRTLHKRFPHADWYLLVDDTTHVFMENLHHALFSVDPSKPIYVGLPTSTPSQCLGVGKGTASVLKQLQYASSAAGILVSRGAAELLVPLANQCIIKYQGCPTGDVRLGLCLHAVNVTLSFNSSLAQGALFQARGTDWTTISFPDDPCLRPITVANADPAAFDLLSVMTSLIQTTMQQPKAGEENADLWSQVAPTSHPWLYAPGSSKLSAQSSPHYSPVTMSDLFKSIMATAESQVMHAPAIKDSARPNGTAYDLDRSSVSLDACRASCVADKACRAWEFDIKALTCRRFKGIPALETRPLAFSGMLAGRYSCPNRLL